LSAPAAAAEACAFVNGLDSFDRLAPPLGGGFDNQRASQAKQRKRKRKHGSFHLFSFTFFYFSESRFFKGLRSKKMKNFPPSATRARGCKAHCLARMALAFLLALHGGDHLFLYREIM
jgi:hypothetical protein